MARARHRARLVLTLTVAVAAVTIGGCSDSPNADPETAPASSTSTTDALGAEAGVIEAYLAAWDAFYAAADPPDPDHPDLPKYLAGAYLSTVRANLAELSDRGTAVRRGEQSTPFEPRIVEITGSAALIEDCWVDADVEFDLETEDTVNDDVVVVSARFRMVEDDGLWKADDNTFETTDPIPADQLDDLGDLDLPCEPGALGE